MIRKVGQIRQDFHDSFLSEEEYQFIEKTAVKAIREKALMARLFPSWWKNGIGWKQEYGYDVMTDLNQATIDTIFRSLNVDTLKKARATIGMVKIERDFFVDRWSMEIAAEEGRNAVAEHVESATFRVAEAEDKFLIRGWTEDGSNNEMEGLLGGAGNDYSTQKNFGTYAEPRAAIGGAIALNQADKFYGPYTSLLTPACNRALRGNTSTTGEPELKIVNALLNDTGYGKMSGNDEETKRIFTVPHITAGKGLVISEDDQDVARVIPGVPLTVETYDKEVNNGLGVAGRVFMTETFVLIRPDAVAIMSDLLPTS